MIRFGHIAFVCLTLAHIIVDGAPARAQSTEPARADYVVAITGVDDPELTATLEAVSKLIANRENPPATIRQLQRRADKDTERLAEVLRSRGFYGHAISHQIDVAARPLAVTVSIAPGPAYRLSDYRLTSAGVLPDEAISVPFATLGISLGMVAEAKPIRRAETALIQFLIDRGYPFADITDRRNVVDHDRQSLAVTTMIATGPRATFAETTVTGLSAVSEGVVRARLAWQNGQIFDPKKIEQTRRALAATQLFTSIHIEHGEVVDAANRLNMRVELTERRPRSIGAGAGFATDEGFKGRIFWEHRNLFGGAEKLRSTLRVGQISSALETTLTVPWYPTPKYDLLFDNQIERVRTDAFDSESIGAGVTLRRRFSKRLSGTIGGVFEWERISDDATRRIFTLVSTPATLSYDSSDNPLDPTRGVRATLSATPYLKALGSELNFIRLQLAESVYWPVIGDNDVVLAARYLVGGIFGEDLNDLPTSKRFFAGGGGSVRGYEFQSIGPRDVDNDPFGGRAVLEVGLELRLRITDEIGIVPFIEGGEVYQDSVPDLDASLQWGAGLGVRYFTAVGPLRLDVAFPINRRREIDDAFQFYISLGQAF